MKYEAPLEPQLVDELFDFWLPIFKGQIDVTPDVLLGHELPHSRIIVHTRRLNGKLAGACLVATSEATPSLGGFGEVATSSDARRLGIATALSRQALDEFREKGGRRSSSAPATRMRRESTSDLDGASSLAQT